VELPNEYVRIAKMEQNLSFSMAPKVKYVPKESKDKNQMDLSFQYGNRKDNIGSLSFSQVK
jgi:hypothetical protein